jgi:hypothetical protein
MTRAERVAVLCAATVAFLFKSALALYTEGTLDAAAFADHLAKIREFGVGVYTVGGAFNNPFNNPPFVIHLLRATGWLTDATGLPFAFWLRFPSIVADAASLYLVWKLLARSHAQRREAAHAGALRKDDAAHEDDATRKDEPPHEDDAAWLLVLLALSPVSLIISGFHGNTDPLMIFFVLLSAYLLETRRVGVAVGGVLLAGVVFGLALNIKVAPLIFAPALWFYLPDGRRRLLFFGLAALVFLCASLPYLLSAPTLIARVVFGYASIYGHWGWTYLAATWFPASLHYARPPHGLTGAHALAASIGKWLMLASIALAAFWFNRREDKLSLPLQLGLATALFLFLTPGFGAQYLAWLVPWAVFLGLRAALLYYVAGGLYLSVSYSCYIYRAAPPFYCVEALNLWLPLVCWASTFVLLVGYVRRLRRAHAMNH